MGTAAVYHRLASPSQPDDAAALQEATGEIWGSYNRDMMGGRAPFPLVDAYVGRLPAGARGIEFTTDVPPNPAHATLPGTLDGASRWRNH